MIFLRCIKDQDNQWYPYKKGQLFKYTPWEVDYQGENEKTRRKKGLYVFCDGHGAFRTYKEGIDVVKIGNIYSKSFSFMLLIVNKLKYILRVIKSCRFIFTKIIVWCIYSRKKLAEEKRKWIGKKVIGSLYEDFGKKMLHENAIGVCTDVQILLTLKQPAYCYDVKEEDCVTRCLFIKESIIYNLSVDRDVFIEEVKKINIPKIKQCKMLVERFGISFTDASKIIEVDNDNK
jgi:hypothetical protein